MIRTKMQQTSRDYLAGVRRFLKDQAGASFIITALSFPVILGFAGLGLDAAMWYMSKRQNQTIADSAAVAGRIALSRDASMSQQDLAIVVRGAAADNGFVHGTDGAVTVNNPPVAGPNAGDANFIEVVVAQQAKTFFSAMLLKGSFMVRARAVSGLSTFGSHCVVALDPTADGAITVTGTADVTSDCGMASNSSSAAAIELNGNATLNANPVQAYGDISVGSNATVTYNVPPQPLSERLADPYAGVLTEHQADPSCVGATKTTYRTADSPLSPGRFCGGMAVNGNVDLLPGTYILDGGGFDIIGGGTVTGEGVTFILTAMDASDLGTFDVASAGLVDLRAPVDTSEGEYPGMLAIQDPYVPNLDTLSTATKNMLTGGSNMTLDGALYFPDMQTVYAGGTNGGANCTLLVSKTVTFTGSVVLDNDATACAEAGVTTGIQQTRVRIME